MTHFTLLYLVHLKELEWWNRHKYLLRILLVACEKSITKKWLKRETPSIDDWIELVKLDYIYLYCQTGLHHYYHWPD